MAQGVAGQIAAQSKKRTRPQKAEGDCHLLTVTLSNAAGDCHLLTIILSNSKGDCHLLTVTF
jgi:hypothetical protein